ncbi:hypothetical protein JCM10914A_40770 [Paenibacillus sp. JCM 10914]|uniref:hypothetical protein n=1 Tax=Paenibacillus sp. JCM 10914 TaxID=1236974 RepID=UPI0003CCB824|nr:hypothetical protein [Paenibacillus sp. JCM 10914]GAE05288.1 hypothetical protein JCM10914_1384 [Paenibacillus sp. JCM 10914]
MNDELLTKLQISPAAVELISIINFLFTLADDKQKLFEDCEGKEGREINRYVNRTRRDIISNRLYDMEDFVKDWQLDHKSALEKLFQEPLNDAKLSKLKIEDPRFIFKIHSTQPHIRFMRFIMIV